MNGKSNTTQSHEERASACTVDITQKLLLKLREAAQLCGLSEYALRKAVRSGELSYRFFNGAYYIPREALQDYIDRIPCRLAPSKGGEKK